MHLLLNRLIDYFCCRFFHFTPSGEARKLQLGVVRTNCMDNLDRTNVVQSAIAKWSLARQLQTVGYLSQGETIDDHDEFLHLFRNSQSPSVPTLMVNDKPMTLISSVGGPCRLHLLRVQWYRCTQDRLYAYRKADTRW
jgi:hypothetical protein